MPRRSGLINTCPILTLSLLFGAGGLRAQLVYEALATFPEKTETVEYNNVARLRARADFERLEEQFGGRSLGPARAALGRLGIPEDQVSEIALGSSKGVFYGLLSGTFSGAAAAKTAAKQGIRALPLKDRRMFCPGGGVCLVFFEDWLAAFGPPDQLRAMLEARQGEATSLSGNRTAAALLNETDPSAPVRGLAPGSLLNAFLADALGSKGGGALNLAQAAGGIDLFAYSVSLDQTAHVKAALDCQSAALAALLAQTFRAFARLEDSQTAEVSSSGAIVKVALDTVLSAK